MKRLIALLLAALLVFGLVACGGGGGGGNENSYGNISWNDGDLVIALVTDYGDIDDESFNQGAWEGVVEFAEARDIPFDFFRPAERGSTAANLDAIDQAIAAGAQILVTPGFLFEAALFEAQDLHEDVHFILLDAVPAVGQGEERESHISDNVAAILYAEEQSGFLAGYAAVYDGYRELGFIGGMAVPAVVRFGSGFVQGAELAAAELGLDAGAVSIRYTYLGSFAPGPEVVTQAASWYADGIEVIFAAAGGAGGSVFAAADDTPDGRAIGVDVDQGHHSERIITSAMKELGSSVYQTLEAFFADRWEGGEVTMFNAANNGVGLPTDFSRFNSFTQTQYDEIFAQLVSGAVVVDDNFSEPNPNDMLTLELITVTFVG